MCRRTQAKLIRDLQRKCNVWLAEPIGFTCFEQRTDNHSCNDVVPSVDSNTDKDNEALRRFAQQVPVLTGPAHWVGNSTSWSVCAAEFLQIVLQAHNWPSRNKALFRSCTHSGNTEIASQQHPRMKGSWNCMATAARCLL